ncbi:VOC family protein [Nocardia sp. XZ_19_385]|uniref:VOC family protein n=1 Tax=Nocardia sp. XZ_19_385 TaxID=2769488 RepID=UPI00188E5BCD|nr:VOC family protein [Nocardia sp. XZ_19_385]
MTPQLDFFSIVVSDMAASVAFYQRLGLAFPEGAETESHAEAKIPGGVRIALDTETVIKSFYPEWQATADGGRIGMAFRCAEAAEVDSVFAELVDAGYEAELKPFDAAWGQRYAVIKDPDGNGVDLYAPLS